MNFKLYLNDKWASPEKAMFVGYGGFSNKRVKTSWLRPLPSSVVRSVRQRIQKWDLSDHATYDCDDNIFIERTS